MDAHFLKMMLGLGILLIGSVLASKTSTKFGIPILLIFIAIGMLCGSDGPGGIEFHDPALTQILGTVALIYILFSGGLSTRLELVAPVWREGVVLASLGVIISTLLMAFFIHWAMEMSWAASALLGATLSSTDAAAVFGILKTRKLGLRPKMQAILELESGSNDPMAVFLTLSLIHFIKTPESFQWMEILRHFFIQMSLGGLLGWWMGKAVVKLINWLDLEFEGLYPVLTLASVATIYSMSEYFGGNGFLSVYLAGLAMGNETYFSRKTLTVFHDGIAWLMQVGMFLAMGLLVNPRDIPRVIWPGIIVSMVLMLLARPLSVWICLLPFRYKLNEMWFLSWGGLRGAVPIILATYFLVENVPEAPGMFNIVFLIVIFTMMIQGSSVGIMARFTGVQGPPQKDRKLPFKSRSGHSDFIEFYIPRSSGIVGKSILQLKLPKDVLVVLIHRTGDEFIPRGNTQIEAQDRLVCLSAKKSIAAVESIFGSEHFFERKMG